MFDLISVLRTGVGILETVVKFTETTVDDKFVELLKLLISHQQLVDWVQDLISDDKIVSSKDEARDTAIAIKAGHAAPEVQHLFAQAGFSWVTVISYLPTVVRLILTLVGKR